MKWLENMGLYGFSGVSRTLIDFTFKIQHVTKKLATVKKKKCGRGNTLFLKIKI